MTFDTLTFGHGHGLSARHAICWWCRLKKVLFRTKMCRTKFWSLPCCTAMTQEFVKREKKRNDDYILQKICMCGSYGGAGEQTFKAMCSERWQSKEKGTKDWSARDGLAPVNSALQLCLVVCMLVKTGGLLPTSVLEVTGATSDCTPHCLVCGGLRKDMIWAIELINWCQNL